MRKREMRSCRVPCHLGRMYPVGAVVSVGSTAVGAGDEVALVAEEPELNDGYTSHV